MTMKRTRTASPGGRPAGRPPPSLKPSPLLEKLRPVHRRPEMPALSPAPMEGRALAKRRVKKRRQGFLRRRDRRDRDRRGDHGGRGRRRRRRRGHPRGRRLRGREGQHPDRPRLSGDRRRRLRAAAGQSRRRRRPKRPRPGSGGCAGSGPPRLRPRPGRRAARTEAANAHLRLATGPPHRRAEGPRACARFRARACTDGSSRRDVENAPPRPRPPRTSAPAAWRCGPGRARRVRSSRCPDGHSGRQLRPSCRWTACARRSRAA